MRTIWGGIQTEKYWQPDGTSRESERASKQDVSGRYVVVTNENVLHCCQAPSGAATHINSALREIGAAFRASDYKQIVCKKDNLMHSFMPLAVWVFPSSQYLLSYLHLLLASDSERENISRRASSSLEPFGYNVYIADSIYAQFKQPDTRAQGTIEAVVCVQIQLGYEGWQGGNSTRQWETLVYLPLSPVLSHHNPLATRQQQPMKHRKMDLGCNYEVRMSFPQVKIESSRKSLLNCLI